MKRTKWPLGQMTAGWIQRSLGASQKWGKVVSLEAISARDKNCLTIFLKVLNVLGFSPKLNSGGHIVFSILYCST